MSTRFPVVNSRPNGHQTARRRRFAASLLVGWVAFWFNTTVLACCAGLAPDVKATSEAAVTSGQSGESSPLSHNNPLRSACTDVTAPAGVVASAAPSPVDRSDNRLTELTTSIHGVATPSASSSATQRFAFTRVPHVPLYLRTARLLI